MSTNKNSSQKRLKGCSYIKLVGKQPEPIMGFWTTQEVNSVKILAAAVCLGYQGLVVLWKLPFRAGSSLKITMHALNFHCFYILVIPFFLWKFDLVTSLIPPLLHFQLKESRGKSKNKNHKCYIAQLTWVKSCLCCLQLEKAQLAREVQPFVPLCVFPSLPLASPSTPCCGSWFREVLCWDVTLFEIAVFIITINYIPWEFFVSS